MIFLHLKCINLISQERRSCPLSAKKICEFLVFFSKSREINPKWGNFTKVSVLSSRWAPLTTLFVCQYRSWKYFICEILMYPTSIKTVEDTIKESLLATTNLVISQLLLWQWPILRFSRNVKFQTKIFQKSRIKQSCEWWYWCPKS